IQVSPNPINVPSATVGLAGQVNVQVKNVGTADLSVTSVTVIDASTGIQFFISNLLTHDCMGEARDAATQMTLQPGVCAELGLRYLAGMDGTFTAKLHVVSSDFGDSPLDVPITVSALTPHIQACDDATGMCNM